MKFAPWFLAALTPFAAIAYNGYLGHAVVVVLTVGIFLGTLSLGKTVADAQVAAVQVGGAQVQAPLTSEPIAETLPPPAHG